MNIRSYHPGDLNALIELTIATFGPFYENHFRPLVGEVIFHHQHGRWADDYRAQVPALHDPAADKYVAVAETGDGAIAGYVAWTVDPARRHGDIVDPRRGGDTPARAHRHGPVRPRLQRT